MPLPSSAMKKRHLRLLTDLSNHIDPEIDNLEYQQFKNLIRDILSPLERKKANNIMEMFRMMEDRGTIKIGDYTEIKNALEGFKQTMIDLIVLAEEDIANLKQTNDNSQAPINLVSSSTVADDRNVSQTIKRPNTEEHIGPPAKERRTDIPDNFTEKSRYEKTRHQTGYHVIINFSDGREGSQFDVVKLRTFYEEELHWEVEVIRDLSKPMMEERLRSLQSSFSDKRFADKYHCFCMTLMSHGNENGIKLDDGTYYPLDDIIKYFKNDRMPSFAGKPKMFLVQACRGSSEQEAVDLPDDEPTDVSDYVGKLSVPVDSDVLIAYATTPGFKSFRRAYDEMGAWFLNEVQEVFKKNHTTDHVEEMLITVRENLAYDPIYRKRDGTKEIRQMPCCWTTLTKRLYL